MKWNNDIIGGKLIANGALGIGCH